MRGFTVKAYITNKKREVHMMGQDVAVCFDMHETSENLRDSYGGTHVASVRVRNSPLRPYVDFLRLVPGAEGVNESHATIMADHFSAEEAARLATELIRAVEYIQNGEWVSP